jgi:hypothetical protein
VRFEFADFEGTQVRCSPSEAVVDGGKRHTRVNRFGVRLEPKVQIHRVINMMAARQVRRREVLEDVVVDFNAVSLLARGFLKLSESAKLRQSDFSGS